MKELLYVIGEPGVGKSTLVAALTGQYEAEERDVPFAHRRYDTHPEAVVELGARRDDFSGTDALAMNVQPKVINFLRTSHDALYLGEGDRLANAAFFDHVLAFGQFRVLIARLYVKPRTALARRTARGSRQNAAWVKSRETKVERLAATFPECVIHVRHEEGDTELALLMLSERSRVAAAFA